MFTGAKSCPICRKQAYDKKKISLTEKYYQEQCIIKIQKWVRGFLARRRFKRLRKLHPPQHPLVRRKYYGEQLSELTSKMDSYLSKREKDIDQLFSDLDCHLEESRHAVA